MQNVNVILFNHMKKFSFKLYEDYRKLTTYIVIYLHIIETDTKQSWVQYPVEKGKV